MMNALARKNDPKRDLKQRATAAYLGLAIGDALGATVEFMTPREIQHTHKIHKNIKGGGWLNLQPGRVTDDTEMSLSLGKAIIKSNGVDALMIAQSFSDWMSSKPVDIGNTVRRGLMLFRQTGVPHVQDNEHNAGNGACMRTLPIALYSLGESDETLANLSKAQAHITHNNDLSDCAIHTVIEMIQMALVGSATMQDLKEVALKLVEDKPEYGFMKNREENPSGYIVDTMRAVFQSFFSTDSFETCLIDVVNRGGDADTTGAIAGMIAGAFYGAQSIPQRWLKKLEEKTRQDCSTQAVQLMERSVYFRSLS